MYTVDIDHDGEIETVVNAPQDNRNRFYVIQKHQLNGYYPLTFQGSCLNQLDGIAQVEHSDPFSSTMQSLDINGDGFRDLSYSSPTDGDGQIFASVAAQGSCLNSITDLRFNGTNGHFGEYFRWGDIDGDGYADLLAYEENLSVVHSFLSSEWGPFSSGVYTAGQNTSGQLVEDTPGDFDGMSLEVIDSGRLAARLPNQQGVFVFDAADIDINDILLAPSNAEQQYYEILDGGNSTHNEILMNIGDIDSSGVNDLIISAPEAILNGSGGRVFILLDP